MRQSMLRVLARAQGTAPRCSPRRLYSSSSSSEEAAKLRPSQQRPSFWQTFSRPIFKVALMAIFTYQLVYYGWMKLETDEIRADAAATIADLEKRIESLEQSKAEKGKK
ncbi:hypothetical protein PFICI_07887 [Pestalotiopsis fici W106-1]|uniref:Inner membrane assembly complex subunit 17 n=1 Tax=Pestalotiopsis fici (strain W106-1 / CGMCC3.15140) TaxID=1229662 RepID=W3X2J0_PESFW|nr:uncharacterized protein PFICI_07887 [Pestalotiopsis fici W106-1]ETS80358.1 hypothetical protein PFICI_07887 [Pestalotiopsis fici W106-1]